MRLEPTLYLVLLQTVSLAAHWYATSRGMGLLRFASGYFAAVTAIFWFSASGAGSVESSDLQPFLEFGLIPLVAATFCWYCSRIGSPWIRVPIVLSTAIVALLTGVLLLSLLLMQSLDVRRELPIYAPDGRHAALVRFKVPDGLDPGFATVAVRRAWFPNAIIVYAGWASMGLETRVISPQVRWLDSSRLLIQLFNHPPDRKYYCTPKVGEITILCEPVTLQ